MNKEKEFINIINQKFNKDLPDDLLLGIGDDAAIISEIKKGSEVICSDSIVEDIHFKLGYFSFKNIGWKSIAINSSDLAAMGAIPDFFTVSIGVPDYFSKTNFEELITGMKNCCDSFGGSIIGGDIVKSDKLFISVTAIGSLLDKHYLTRDSAKEGEKIAVTGNLGNSLGGLKLLMDGEEENNLVNFHLEPKPKINESKKLLKAGIRCCMDISDGLHNDLLNLSEKSEVSMIINVNKIPTSEELKSSFPNTFNNIAINGGEDYELLFTFDESKIKLPFKHFIIGDVVKKHSNNVVYKYNNKIFNPKLNPWSHFE